MIPSNNEVTEIAALVQLQLARTKAVEEIEEQLKAATEALRQVQEVDLPSAMYQAGVSEIRLPTGERISLKEDVYCSIPKDHRYHEALDWLREHGYGDVIKNEVKVAFGKGEEQEAQTLIQELNTHGWRNYTNNVSVHPSTLKALIKECLAQGKDIPMDTFGAGPITKAVIKMA